MAVLKAFLLVAIAANFCCSEYLFVKKNKAYEMDIVDTKDGNVQDNKACQCSQGSCNCCIDVKVKKIHLKGKLCMKVSLLASKLGISVSVTIDGRTVFKKEVSVKDPPPVCGKIEKADVCIIFHDLNLTSKELSGCAKFEAKLFKVKVASVEIGCFKIPIGDRETQALMEGLPKLLGMLADFTSEFDDE